MGNTVEKGVAVVTGGSRGIGAAVCRLLALQGYAVVVNYNSKRKEAEEVVADISEKGGRAAALQANVGEECDVVRLFGETDKLWPGVPLTALVNNAGVIGVREQGLDQMDTASFHAM